MISVHKSCEQILGHSTFTRLSSINRYAIITESDNKKTALYFSTPIFKESNGSIVNATIKREKQFFYMEGSNSFIRIFDDSIELVNKNGKIKIAFGEKHEFRLSGNRKALVSDFLSVYPTFNGVVIKEILSATKKVNLKIMPADLSLKYKGNSKYFALMKEKFKPVFTVNAMFAVNRYGDVFYNTILNSRNNSGNYFDIEIKSTNENAYKVIYEVNLYEPKLLQDTTVESKRPKENNVYGDISFIGKSPDCGEQFLYSRIDLTKIEKIKGYQPCNAKLYIPCYMKSNNDLKVSSPFKRFCSFGSNWKNKIPNSGVKIKSGYKDNFIYFDLTEHILNRNGELNDNEGIIIQSNQADSGFFIIATADNYFTPQILEIQYSKIKKEKY